MPHLILRGLRTVADFEYEFQLVAMTACSHRKSNDVSSRRPNIWPSSRRRWCARFASYGGDISRFVDPVVAAAMKQNGKT